MPRKLATPELFPHPAEPPEPPEPIEHGLYVDVAVNRPLRCEFTYAVPRPLRALVAPGVRVAVPFGPRRELGVVTLVRTSTDVPPAKLKAVARVLDTEMRVDPELFELTRWISGYYACSWGEALAAVMPAALKKESEGRRVAWIEAVGEPSDAVLAELGKRSPKGFRLLRTLRELGTRAELRELCRKL